MARKLKKIISNNVDRREVGYYSTPDFVSQYIFFEMMKLRPIGLTVLDPAVGNGELIVPFVEAGKIVDGYDIIDYPNRSRSVNFHHADFTQSFIKDKEYLKHKAYDYIIMNPPFNCHEHSYIASNKRTLLEHFEAGIFNMFALFLEAVIEIAKDGCIIGAIVPDSLLFATSYNKLRLKIFQECDVHQIILCSDDLFRQQAANVSTCIMIIQKGKSQNNGMVRIANRPSDIENFRSILKKRRLEEVNLKDLYLKNDDRSGIFIFDRCPELLSLFSDCARLGDIYECGGGVSTGNDSAYTSTEYKNGFTIPFYPNVISRFTANPGTFLCDDYQEQSKDKRNFIIRHRDRLSHEGIVCSGIGKRFYASYLPEAGVNGVNTAIWPVKEDLFWLLAYLNSSLVTYLLKGIIARGNMTTIGSVSSLPIISLSDSDKKSLDRIAKNVIFGKISVTDAIAKIDRIVYRNLNLPLHTRRKIARFCADIPHLV